MTVLFLFLSVIAIVFKVLPPKKINYLYGYKTSNSMKNIENWNVANKYSANIMLTSMLLLLIVSYILDLQNIEATNLLICLLMIAIGIMIFLTEKRIKHNQVSKS